MQPPAGEFPRAQTDNQRIPQKRKYSIFLNMSKDNLELKYFCVFCKKEGIEKSIKATWATFTWEPTVLQIWEMLLLDFKK